MIATEVNKKNAKVETFAEFLHRMDKYQELENAVLLARRERLDAAHDHTFLR